MTAAPAASAKITADAPGRVNHRERRVALATLSALTAAFTVFLWQAVQRSVNGLWGDVAFSGWTAAIAHRIVSGDAIYRDFVLPLPPGSFAVLARIERWTGGPSMLAESAVCAASTVVLALLAYAIAARLSSRRVALYAAAGTFAWISGWSKELAYDYLAEVTAYAGIWLLVLLFCSDEPRRARRLAFAAGVAVGATVLFKQSTAVGLFGAGVAGLAYLATIERADVARLRARAVEGRALLLGTVTSFTAVLAVVAALRGSVPSFLRVVFVDGPKLKGGTRFLVEKTLRGIVFEPLASSSLGQVTVVVVVACLALTRAVPRRDGPPDASASHLTIFDVLALLAVAGGGFLFAAGVLARGGHVPSFVKTMGLFAFPTSQAALIFAVILFFVNARKAAAAREAHGFNAAAVSTFVLACGVGGSLVMFRPLDEANATIVVVLAALFETLERAGLRWLSPLALAFLVAGTLSSRVPRCLAARTPAALPFWRGLSVGPGGVEAIQAASRVRALTTDGDTVLVLPEDPALVALIGRPRPALCGAIVFADQYPERCLAADAERLDRHPPRVVVTHPTAPGDWVPIFRSWNPDGPAERLTRRFLDTHLDEYRHDTSFTLPWGDAETALDVWVRK